MSKKTYCLVFSGIVGIVGLGLWGGVPALARLLNIEEEHILAYLFLLIGLSVFYFGLLRPQWFTKELVPTRRAVKFKVAPKNSWKTALKDDSFFWHLFPYGLFFSFGGLAYLLHPSPMTLVVALVCSLWVKLLYKFV